MQFVVPLLYSEVVSTTQATPASLTELIHGMDWREVISRAIAIANISFIDGVEDPRHQRSLVQALVQGLVYDFKILRAIEQQPARDLVTREGLLALLRAAFIERREPEDGSQFQDLFVKANLAANELIVKELEVFGYSGKARDLLASELRSALLQGEALYDAVRHTEAFFSWSKTQEGVSDNYLPISSDFEAATSVPWQHYLLAAYALNGRVLLYRTWDEARRGGVWFDEEQFVQGIPNSEIVREAFVALQITLAEAIAEWEEEESLSLAGFGPLWASPVIRDGKWYTVPYPPLLINAMGDGIYFKLLDYYDEEQKRKFMPLFGEFFEDYIVSIFTSAYEERPDTKKTTEVLYGGDKSSDFIVQENGDVVFVEVVAKRMKFRDSILRLNEESIKDDLRKGILCKVEQLDRNIRDFREGRLLPEWPRFSGQRYYPVLVAPRDWPRVYVLTEFLPAEGSAFLQDCEPIEMLSMGEVESIELALRGGMNLGDLLFRKNRSWPQLRYDSLHNFLLTPREKHRIPNVMSPARSLGRAFVRELVELAGLTPPEMA